METFKSLKSTVNLNLPSESTEPNINLKIQMNKMFLYHDQLGWNWHKSWNIPSMKVEIELKNPVNGEVLILPHKLNVEVKIVKAVIKEIAPGLRTIYLEDVGVQGDCSFQFHNQKCNITGLKFQTTSYSQIGNKFHIVLIITIEQNKFQNPQILLTRISPQVYVDSRRSARETKI